MGANNIGPASTSYPNPTPVEDCSVPSSNPSPLSPAQATANDQMDHYTALLAGVAPQPVPPGLQPALPAGSGYPSMAARAGRGMFGGYRAAQAAAAGGEAAAAATASAAEASAVAATAPSVGLTVLAPAGVAAAGAGLVYIYSRPGVMEETIARVHGWFNPPAFRNWQAVTQARERQAAQDRINAPGADQVEGPTLDSPSNLEKIVVPSSGQSYPLQAPAVRLPASNGIMDRIDPPDVQTEEYLGAGPWVSPTNSAVPTPPPEPWGEERVTDAMVEIGEVLPTLANKVGRGLSADERSTEYGELVAEYNRLNHQPDLPTEEEVRDLSAKVEALKAKIYSPQPQANPETPSPLRHIDTPFPLRPEFNDVAVTPGMMETMERIRSRARDLDYPEMKGFLKGLGYQVNQGSGSVRTFSRPHSPPLTIHEPHGGERFHKPYVLQLVQRVIQGEEP